MILMRPEARRVEKKTRGQLESSELFVLVGLRLRPKTGVIDCKRDGNNTVRRDSQKFNDLVARMLAESQDDRRSAGPTSYATCRHHSSARENSSGCSLWSRS